MIVAAMSQARDPRDSEQPGGAIPPQLGHNVAPFLDKNPFSVNAPLGGGTANPLLPSPASLQLAQLQAQLTLQRIKLAQSAVTNNTAAATVLNQVLSKVAMSQPLFNPLRHATMVGPHGHAGVPSLGPTVNNTRFPSSGIPFSPHSSVAQNPNQNSLPPFGKGMSTNKTGSFYAGSQIDTEQTGHHLFTGGVHNSGTIPDVHYGHKHDHPHSFKKDYYDSHGQHHVMNQKGDFPNTAPKSHWESPQIWQSSGQHYETRNELYNPEEPTTDNRFSPSTSTPFNQHNNGKAGNCTSNLKSLKPHELNDFHGIPPLHLPHTCTICDKKVFNLKDWDLHVKGRMHIQNLMGYSESSLLCIPNCSDGMLTTSVNSEFNPMINEGFKADTDSSYIPSVSAVSYLQTGLAFSSPPAIQKISQKKSAIGRVVHICNLPEGSCNENDVVNLGLPFGKVTNYILMKSTNQAFLEMAYTEAAEAMVKFYQEKPAMINDEKLLIRMSKRYKELQLKKPGKNVDAIIYDIHSQRERDLFRDTDRYRNERTRSRSPISRSLSPRSHTPSFTSCSSTQSPLGASRAEWGNGRDSWDQSAYGRWEDEREQALWRDNGEEKKDRTDHWVHDRKHYSRTFEKQDFDDRSDGPRCHRDKKGTSHSSSRHKRDGEYYRKEAKSKSESKPHEMTGKLKRKEESKVRDSRGSHEEVTNKRNSSQPKPCKVDDSRELNADKKKHDDKDVCNKDNEQSEKKDESMDHNSLSPIYVNKLQEQGKETGTKHKDNEWESGSELEGETWYPTNMEELVTVDEVGEEDFIIEPDITELEEIIPVNSIDDDNSNQVPQHTVNTVELRCSQLSRSECSVTHEASIAMSSMSVRESTSPNSSCCDLVKDISELNHNTEQKGDELEASISPCCSHEDISVPKSYEGSKESNEGKQYCSKGNVGEDLDAPDTCKRLSSQADDDVTDSHIQEESHDTKHQDLSSSGHSVSSKTSSSEVSELELKEMHSSPSWEQEDVFAELNIPLGVEFVVPRTGFFCKLCGLFYTSEETAKTSHCRSRVHYKNLQSYLSKLAEGSSEKIEAVSVVHQEDGIVPHFEENQALS
ncbi:RNA-binding protein 20 isoform X2 [Bombina bombina]|uniref:RNA-binding protein 20 isoform X2 n=1 Tax=Bombina bombina TaxID=8345 RepID=UPI00235B0D6B|nr:RNA-binding protein 20 isoform X2 [Bombina bombina]